jgi:hypothetical protein
MIVRTVLLAFGTNAVSITPVVRLKARIRLRVSTVLLPLLRAWVNVPPNMILLPASATAYTSPSSTCGVKLAGSSLTR